MPSIYQLKPAFQNVLRPIVRRLYQMGITANQVTLLAMLISVALSIFLYFYFKNHKVNILLLVFPLWMLVRMAFNAIDGMLAREFKQQTKIGAFYNELCDIISDTFLYICFITFTFIQPALLLFVIFLAILSEYTGVMAPLIGQDRRYDGPMGKSDRAFCFSSLAIIIVIFPLFSDRTEFLFYITNAVLLVIGLLLCITIYNRIKNSID
ncbi:CDP-alcohol phosphatidyltransferase family protein [Acinetobacter gerneri]|nr:CDP-alcohol phosphatidyltransferase family protein [Acinetobacter gerneri]EPR82304.1 CDP-diacylglycerol--glycerol-3-phosphate 3-phosphatidyltransferase [Acinetobacter gerneri DSM 14967 = CIP 107464 = MTCC 9824]MDQ9012101.1 CDP-alcohol phosphatidyltransferase family protein [Acinetobacter gerneri]MDQ9016201.1 CDP-alcohol phosphatidyltransferase family protein [Acinetobacter gerneri]MDQ9027367.1 CDP-alcohol phosphatidyltransferase family protein [Acinetobacter gerneri]MDQ9054670.1 CDP-alcohol